MNNYEVMFIVSSKLESASVKEVAERMKDIVTDNRGRVNEFKELGQKKLAYDINKESNGYYYLMTVSANIATINELDRKSLINENILRHLIINLDKEK